VVGHRGLAPEGASAGFLPGVVGVARAAEWLYTGRVFGAEEARRGGLVRSVHPDDQLRVVARELAAEIAAAAPLSVALTRQMLWRMLRAEHPMIAHPAHSRAVHTTGKLPDAMEGVMSFLEKRPASFTGKVSTELPDIFPEWDPPEYR